MSLQQMAKGRSKYISIGNRSAIVAGYQGGRAYQLTFAEL